MSSLTDELSVDIIRGSHPIGQEYSPGTPLSYVKAFSVKFCSEMWHLQYLSVELGNYLNGKNLFNLFSNREYDYWSPVGLGMKNRITAILKSENLSFISQSDRQYGTLKSLQEENKARKGRGDKKWQKIGARAVWKFPKEFMRLMKLSTEWCGVLWSSMKVAMRLNFNSSKDFQLLIF